MKRRDFLRTAGGTAAVAGGTAAATTPAAAQSKPSFGGWLDGTSNYDGVHDMTGKSEVTVTVGAQGNQGNFAFGPAAIQIDPGTTVVWEWNGKGGGHNVHAMEGASFTSETVSEAGHTFSHTFESEGVVKYQCDPHASLGMKGVVVTGALPGGDGGGGGDGAAGGGGGGGGGGGEKDLHDFGVPLQAHWVGSATMLMVFVSLVFTFYVLKYGESPNTGNTGGGED